MKISMPRRVPDGHMHDYDDNWKCKCGHRLVTDLDQKTGRLNVRACVTREGKIIPFGENVAEDTEKPVRRTTRRTTR
jgi:hypothetical protein